MISRTSARSAWWCWQSSMACPPITCWADRTKNHPTTELNALHLGDDAIEVLRTGKFNHRLLSELICHKDFQRFMLEAVRQMALMKNGSSEEKKIRAYLATFGLDYDALTKEEFVSIISGHKKSKYLRSPISQRRKARPQLPHGKGKRKRK